MADYNYTISIVFPSGLSVGQLDAAIINSAITTTLVGLIRDNIADLLTVRFVTLLSGAELTMLTAVIAAYVPTPNATIPPTGSLVSFNLVNMVYRATTSSFITVGQFAWDQLRYSQFVNGIVVIDVVRYDRSLEFILYDTVASTTLASGIVGVSGVSSWPILMPRIDTVVQIRIRKTLLGGQDPLVSSVNLELIS